MPDYIYSSRGVSKRALRSLEIVVWLGLAAMIGFLMLAALSPAVKTLLEHDRRVFPFVLVVMYLLFLIPSRRLYRHQRCAAIEMKTTRRGFTYVDAQGEKILSWRDITRATVILDADPPNGAHVRRVILAHARGRVVLDNDPPQHELLGMSGLLREIDHRLKDVAYRFHWFHALCPFCKGALAGRKVGCPTCGRAVQYVPKLLRPWEMLREEGLYFILILLVAGPLFLPLMLFYLIWALAMPLAFNRAATLRPLAVDAADGGDDGDDADASEPRAARKRRSRAPAATAVLLLASAMWASAGGPVAAAPVPVASPSAVSDAAYFPLAVGDTWEYRYNYTRVVMRVTGQEIVNGVTCFVVESFVGDDAQSTQREYYAYTSRGLEVLKRTHKGSDFFLDSPEPMLLFPLSPGRRWTWQGTNEQGAVFLAFSVREPVLVRAMKQSMAAVPVLVEGRSGDGWEIQTKRWFVRGVGMVRELTTMRKGAKNVRVEGNLEHYSIKAEGP